MCIRDSTYAMNTVIEQKWYGESADTVYTGMETKIREIESVLSLHLSQSEIATINENAGVQPVEDVYKRQVIKRFWIFDRTGALSSLLPSFYAEALL